VQLLQEEGPLEGECHCMALRRKEQATATTTSSAKASSSSQPATVAVVKSENDKFYLSTPIVIVNSINNINSNLSALIDTGSPVSFISLKNFSKMFKLKIDSLDPVDRKFNALPKTPINVLGKIKSRIEFREFPDRVFDITLHVVKSDFSDLDLIIGCDFIEQHELTLIFRPSKVSSDTFMQPLLQMDVYFTNISIKSIIDDCEIDFDKNEKQRLKEIIIECSQVDVSVVDDDYSVSVNLKDNSTYAYAPRKFALKEREQIREITDNLLERGIIKTSTSPYCARIVPVRKKNGKLRLCVDLRPLNARVIKQKYPFPLIEDCLARLSDKRVYSLLDLKDGFHQIKVNPEYTKYFSFATPDGQFEYVRLPFGYSESPAEFQKRVQILQPFIRENKILVYIDDILIASSSVEENLSVLKEVLLTLRKYSFELNLAKCNFLRKKPEFLGYIISHNQLTLSDRHTEVLKNFPVPKSVHQLQRFLGLAGYFRKFIQNFATKARPLHNLLKKSVEFKFDEDCITAFDTLKKELTAYPVLHLYNPAAPTELHTDASSQGLGAILLQKQANSK